MYVNVNPANMARAIQGFVKAAGGAASYSAALELVARMCGFDAYRAQKAYAETNADKDDVVFETVLHAWDEGEEQGTPSQAERRKAAYRLQVEKFGDQLRLAIVPDDVKNLMESDGRNVLDVLLEINQGLPCLHMTNDPAGEMLLTVFGHAGGLLVREDEGELEQADNANAKLAEHMRDEEWFIPVPREDAYVINRDTGEHGADVENKADGALPVPPVTGPSADVWPDVRVVTGFHRVSTDNPAVWHFDLEVFEGDDPEPVVGCESSGTSRFRVDAAEPEMTEFKRAMEAAFSLYYRRTGSVSGLSSVNLLVQSCLDAGVELPRRLVEVAQQNPEASAAELETLFRMTAAVWTTVKNRT